jgi:outer membrane beta-barrel protein
VRPPLLRFIPVVALAALLAGPARADNPLLDDAPPVMNYRPVLEGRHLLSLQFGLTLGDPYVQNLMAGLGYRYHLTSWFGFGLDAMAGGGVRTSLADDIEAERSTPEAPFELSTSAIRFMGALAVEFVPFSGKALVFSDAVVRIDLHLTLGIGAALVSGDGLIEDSVSIAPMFGVGLRIFPTQWLSIGFDLKDWVLTRQISSRRDETGGSSVPAAEFGHNWMFGLSVGFSFPTNPAREVGQ